MVDPFEAGRRVAAQLEAILAIHNDDPTRMRRACEIVSEQALLMRSAVRFARLKGIAT